MRDSRPAVLRGPSRERARELLKREEQLCREIAHLVLHPSAAGSREIRRLRKERQLVREELEDLHAAAKLARELSDGWTRFRDVLETDSRPLRPLGGVQ
ncbi:MAG: hypothetical protein EA421_05375 [Gemmatimonadales bacterium]|nr:MAG: hypothetical protein EA421_05375 [Gemmatimonadales bacterium]